jgi:voltage-gated potassium channel Kch
MSPDAPEGKTFALVEGRLGRRQLTARRAAAVISIVTIVLTLAGGLLIRVADSDSFPTVGSGLWWAIQTLTTVGYGDIVPASTAGKLIATIVMINGIAFLTVITAAVTASLIDQLRRRRAAGESGADEAAVLEKLDEISGRLDEIESAVGLRRQDREP